LLVVGFRPWLPTRARATGHFAFAFRPISTRRQDCIIEIMASAAGSGPMPGGDKRSDTIANYGADDKRNRH
jgi:hypothetical protein